MGQKDTADNAKLKAVLKGFIDKINIEESTEWETETDTVSKEIRKALVGQLSKNKVLSCDVGFLDYCNCIKSLLAVYNYGSFTEMDENDKKLIKEGINKIIKHVEEVGCDLTPYLGKEDCLQIFSNDDVDKRDPADKHIDTAVTFSAATVMTTLVYFRRACKRKGFFADDNLDDLTNRVAKTIASIMIKFADFVRANGYAGWGFTLDPKQSVAVTLNDTYSVVDAISRFADAFKQDEEIKRDQEFLDKVSEIGKASNFEGDLVECCVNAMYRVAYNTYMRDKDKMYGKSIFYTNAVKQNNNVAYSYYPITIEQIASSNRASALFNPLYVAMITMYGYLEKELVIYYFMENYKEAADYYKTYETDVLKARQEGKEPSVKTTISEFAQTDEINRWYRYSKEKFAEDIAWITKEHPRVVDDYDDSNEQWARYYNISRLFQKYVEKQVNGDLMEIDDYRTYLNATKDAIDQVQVAYRKLNDSQRLGIVDTDYVMFSGLDVDADSVTISKLNKASISVNYLRPMLLSSKIMIVNALTKYPQADMESLYNAIKDSKHRINVKKKDKSAVQYEWLWNEDAVDMNATARHCEAIMYDYFDYYERYELSYKALNNLKKYFSNVIAPETVSDDGELNVEAIEKAEGMNDFRRVVLNLTRRNVEEVRAIYTDKLQDKNGKIDELNAKLKNKEKEYADKIAELKKEYEQKLQAERAKHQAELEEKKVSIEMGNTVRGWIRDEADRHLQEMLACMIINNVNGYYEPSVFKVEKILSGESFDEVVDANFDVANGLSQKIMQAYRQDPDEAEQAFGDKFRSARRMQILFEGALDEILKNKSINSEVRNSKMLLSDKNDAIRSKYGAVKKAIREKTNLTGEQPAGDASNVGNVEGAADGRKDENND